MVCLWSLAGLPLRAESLPDLLARVDKSAAAFRGMTAKLRRINYTAVIKDTSEDKGVIAIKLNKSREMQLRIDFNSPDEKTWAFRGRKAELFIPKINTVQEYDLGKHGKLVDQFLLLGFGSNSKDLAKSYTLSPGGEETVEGQQTSKLVLVPKSAEAQEHLKKVEIWFPLTSGYPVQQKFYLGSGDYMEVHYTDAKLDPNLSDAAVRLTLPPGVKREYPQK
jgi:outer membrane lipoprotein-sorting protein